MNKSELEHLDNEQLKTIMVDFINSMDNSHIIPYNNEQSTYSNIYNAALLTQVNRFKIIISAAKSKKTKIYTDPFLGKIELTELAKVGYDTIYQYGKTGDYYIYHDSVDSILPPKMGFIDKKVIDKIIELK